LQAIYVSGWQGGGGRQQFGAMYPDQSLYPADSVPKSGAAHQSGADAGRPDPSRGRGRTENTGCADGGGCGSRLGGNLNAFELMKAMIEAGAACVHFEDQLSVGEKVWASWAEKFWCRRPRRFRNWWRRGCGGRDGSANADYGAHRRR